MVDNVIDQEKVKDELGINYLKKFADQQGPGYICTGAAYDTDKYGKVFIKVCGKSMARTMFDGEFASLLAIQATYMIQVPRPIQIVDLPSGGAALVLKYIEMKGGVSELSASLGERLARMHLHNTSLKEMSRKAEGSVHKDKNTSKYVSQFGFHVNTCCGFFEMDNTWCMDWPSFYANKVEMQIKLIEERGDRQARELWNQIVPKLSKFFEGIHVEPALVHGDMWLGNVGETSEGPVIFDPASYYGHSEYELGMDYVFNEFDAEFHNAYHKLIPKAPGFENRMSLYALYQHLNHWNHFPDKILNGRNFKDTSLVALQTCIKQLDL